jgi:hypothetical protein
LLYEHNAATLSVRVEEFINDGWQLYGYPFSGNAFQGDPTLVFQAVIKEENRK